MIEGKSQAEIETCKEFASVMKQRWEPGTDYSEIYVRLK